MNDSERMYNHMKATESIYNPSHPIQSWTADMWTVFWNGLCFGNTVKIDKDLDFCWAVDNVKRWNETYIFHNAGLPGDSDTHFSKITYQNSPFNQNIKMRNDNCTYMYYLEVKETENNFPEIIDVFNKKIII